MGSTRRMLITAGPTHEPLDAVRFIGNRSSGRVGISLASAAAGAGWKVTLLLGPTRLDCADSGVKVLRYQSTADLERLLSEHFARCDVLVMAAAVADFRPAEGAKKDAKMKRTEGGLNLQLESTPDLLAACAARRRAGQVLIGFALDAPGALLDSAREKLERKGVDAIVANPPATMEAPTIEATLVMRGGAIEATDGAVSKEAFARWLLERIEGMRA